MPDVVKEFAISEATCHRWRAPSGGMQADDVKRLKELEVENALEPAGQPRFSDTLAT